MRGQPFKVTHLKRYSLEVYGESAEDLIWKLDSDEPFTPMNRGDKLLLLDAPGTPPEQGYEIIDVEHVIWTAGEQIRYVTRIHTSPAMPLG